ncbi:MAG: MarR family winged helix-turn-helix transcriptional regulator [Spirochaetia bacterium]|nr:MarR family winged helix-turn-helix transcriptional regulator [Spirochaetia bacterium]
MKLKKTTLQKINITCVNDVVKKFSRSIGIIYDRKLAKNNITVNQFSILSYIFYYENIALGKLAEHLKMDRTTLTKNLKPLFREHYIEIIETDDKRKKNLHLTPIGVKLLEDSIELWKEAQQTVYKKYGKKNIHQLLSLLHRIL